jgi:transcriptional regulator with XRE-family HTH domain
MNIGKAIKLCRIQRGLSQAELAEKSGLSVSYLSLLERNKRDPLISTVNSIAKSLQVPMVILTFMGSSENDLLLFSSELKEKLSYSTFLVFEEKIR